MPTGFLTVFNPRPMAEIELLDTFSAPAQKSASTLGAVIEVARVVMTAPFIFEVAISLMPRPVLSRAFTAAPSPEIRRFLLLSPSMSKSLSPPDNFKTALSTLMQTRSISPPLIATGEMFTDVARGSTGNFDGIRIFTSCESAYVGSGIAVCESGYVIVADGFGDSEVEGADVSVGVVADCSNVVALGEGVAFSPLTSCDDPEITFASEGITCTAKRVKSAAAATRLATSERLVLMR